MAHGVLPPRSGIVAGEAFMRWLAHAPEIRIDDDTFVGDSENIQGVSLLGHAANRLEVPGDVVAEYVHTLRIAKRQLWQSGWPPLQLEQFDEADEVRFLLTLVAGEALSVTGCRSALRIVKRALDAEGCQGTGWRAALVGELHPIVRRAEAAIGDDVIARSCLRDQ